VWVLPAGQEAVDPLEVLRSPRMSKFLTGMRAAFDWLLIDSTPLLPIADAEVLSLIADGTIVVVRRDKSSKTELKQALARVAPSKTIGLLLNDFPAARDYGESYTVGKRSGGSEASQHANRFKSFTTQLKQASARVAPSKMIGLLPKDFPAAVHFVSRTLWEGVRTGLALARKRTRFKSFTTKLKQASARIAPSKMIGLVRKGFPATVHSVGLTLWESVRNRDWS
jgi:hypothetical protein